MKRFYRNETLHQSGPAGAGHNRKALRFKQLERGMAYATLEVSNSLFEGCDDVYFTYPSQINSDYCGAGGSRLLGLQPVEQSIFFQAQRCSPVGGSWGAVLSLHSYLWCVCLCSLYR